MLLFTYDEKLHKQNEKNENIAEGRAQGLAEGRSQGRAESTKSMQLLLEKLFADNRIDDIKKISEDTDYLNKLLEEYNIQER